MEPKSKFLNVTSKEFESSTLILIKSYIMIDKVVQHLLELIDLPNEKAKCRSFGCSLARSLRLHGGQARARRRDTLVERRGKLWRKVMAIAEIFHRLREPVPPISPDRARRVFIVIGSRVCAQLLGHRVMYRTLVERRRDNKAAYTRE